MSFKKNQKRYNKDVMETGRQANQYMRNALGLINKYTTDYAGRNDFWASKLNDRQLNLLSDKYLAQNANMLRGQAAFGSNSETNRQIQNNAYDQQNYLANVANQNIMNANVLQQNELASLGNAASTYQNPIAMGANAAQNVDALNWDWLNAIGKGMQTVGQAGMSSGNPWGMAIGAAVNQTGGTISALTSDTTSLTPEQSTAITSNMNKFKEGLNQIQANKLGGNVSPSNFTGSNSSLSVDLSKPQNLGFREVPTFKGFGVQ